MPHWDVCCPELQCKFDLMPIEPAKENSSRAGNGTCWFGSYQTRLNSDATGAVRTNKEGRENTPFQEPITMCVAWVFLQAWGLKTNGFVDQRDNILFIIISDARTFATPALA